MNSIIYYLLTRKSKKSRHGIKLHPKSLKKGSYAVNKQTVKIEQDTDNVMFVVVGPAFVGFNSKLKGIK